MRNHAINVVKPMSQTIPKSSPCLWVVCKPSPVMVGLMVFPTLAKFQLTVKYFSI